MDDNLIKITLAEYEIYRKMHANVKDLLPDQPDVHSQLNSPTPSEQMPPFRHGFGVHSLRSVLQKRRTIKINKCYPLTVPASQ